MFRRLFVGLVLGLVVGGLVAAGVVAGLKQVMFTPDAGGAVLAYLAAIVTGAVTGLVAGKPIWSAGGKIEAGLKAFFGALIAAGGMFALRTWVGASVDLGAIGAGSGTIGQLPAASLPIIAAVLGGFFELDNTGSGEKNEKDDAPKKRVDAGDANGKGKARVAPGEEEEEESDGSAARAKRAKS